MRLPVAHHQIGEADRIGRSRGASDGRKRDRHRGVAVAESGDPFGLAHRLPFFRRTVSAGVAVESAAASS